MRKSFIKKTAIVMSAVMALSVMTVTGCSDKEEEETTVETEAPTTTTTAATETSMNIDELLEMGDEAWETFDINSIEMPEELRPEDLEDPHMRELCQDYIDDGYMLFGGMEDLGVGAIEGFMGMASDMQLDFTSTTDMSEVELGTTTSCTVVRFASYDEAVSYIENTVSTTIDLTKVETSDGVEYSGSAIDIPGVEVEIHVYDDGVVDMIEVMDLSSITSMMGY